MGHRKDDTMVVKYGLMILQYGSRVMQFVPIYYHVLNFTTLILNLPGKALRSIYSLRHRKCFVRRYIHGVVCVKSTLSLVPRSLKQLVNIDCFHCHGTKK